MKRNRVIHHLRSVATNQDFNRNVHLIRIITRIFSQHNVHQTAVISPPSRTMAGVNGVAYQNHMVGRKFINNGLII